MNKIYNYLDQLLNKPICDIGRVSNMLWIAIGETFEENNIWGQKVEKSTISLHVQSGWRIVNKEKDMIWFASSDFYSPNSKTEEEEEFDWDIQGNNLFDEKSKLWLSENRNILIKRYKINELGDLSIAFSNGDCLEIMTDSSDDTESWRILKCKSDEKHMVASGLGIDF